MGDKSDRNRQLVSSIRTLRDERQPLEALASLFELIVRSQAPQRRPIAAHFLGRPAATPQEAGVPCLLLEAARFQSKSNADGSSKQAPSESDQALQLDRIPGLIASLALGSPGQEMAHLKGLAELRCRVIRLSHTSAGLDQIDRELREIVSGYDKSWGCSSLPAAQTKSKTEPIWLPDLPSEDWRRCFRRLASESPMGWDSPSLHFVGQCLLFLWGHDLTPPAFVSHARVLLANTQRGDGEIGDLYVEAIPGGCGVVFPHPLYAGYLMTETVFQKSLLDAVQALRHDTTELLCDFRWSLRTSDPNDPEALSRAITVSGDSAGAAFYCAMRAAINQESLDTQTAITAAISNSSIEGNQLPSLFPVGSIIDKLSGLRSERDPFLRHRISRIFVSSDQLWRGKPIPSDGLVESVNDWTVTLHSFADRKKAYESLTEYGRIARAIKQHLAAQADELLEGEHGLCKPYIRPRFTEVLPRHWNDSSQPLVPESMTSSGAEPPGRALTPEENFALLAGTGLAVKKPVLVLADSGMGKSSFLLAAEREIARQDNTRVPVRLGAGPKSTRINDEGRPIPKAPLSDLLGTTSKPNKRIRSAVYQELQESLPLDLHKSLETWFTEATKRGDLIFLLDALDQTADDIPLPRFFRKFPNCPSIVTGRPEIKQSRKESQNQIDWREHRLCHLNLERTKDEQGNSNPDSDIDEYCRAVPGLADLLLGNDEWHDLIQIPVLLDQMRKLYVSNPRNLIGLKNREAVYDATLKMLLTQSVNATGKKLPRLLANRSPDELRSMLAEYAFEMWEVGGEEFTGSLRGTTLSRLNERFPGVTDILNALNATTFGAYFDQSESATVKVIAWRHLSFGEWFAGLHLAKCDKDKQREFFEKHARTPNRGWVIAFAMAAADRMQQPEVVERMARWLIEYGNPFRLHRILKVDKLIISDRLMGLCNWLVHRDREFREVEAGRPGVDLDIARILETMFSLDKRHHPKYRDSRWLDAAWELICHAIGAQGEETTPETDATGAREICQSIHDQFLSEFETRLKQYRSLTSIRDQVKWLIDNRGLVQLVPEECLESLGLPAPNIATIRVWPEKSTGLLSADVDYRRRRDLFNEQLAAHHANWCLCPPKGWEFPDGRLSNECQIGVENPAGDYELKRGNHSIKPDYFLQRAPMTNLEFEAFDPGHKSFRQLQWKREGESDETALENHPVVEVSWFQARMMAIWMTGKRQMFGQFELPEEKDWEACCRAGRDGESDISGIPWVDENGLEHFDVLTSQQANFNGEYPEPENRPELKGRSIVGTVPVGQYRANGFGLVDMQGQVWEWQRDVWVSSASPAELAGNKRSVRRVVRGGSWYNFAGGSRTSNRYGDEAEFRNNDTGFRLTRTRSN